MTELDLHNNLYDYKNLKSNIYFVSLISVLKTQKLTTEFCAKYILNKDYQFLEQDMNITIHDVIKLQPHIDKKELIKLLVEIEKKRRLQQRTDSFDFMDF